MFNTKLIKLIYLLYHSPPPSPAQAPFAVNFVDLNRFSSKCNFFLNFVSFFESLKHTCFSML